MDKSTIHTIVIVLSIFGALVFGNDGLKTEIAKVRDDVGEVRSELAGVKADIADIRVELAGVKADIADIRAELAEMRGALNAHITGHQHGIADAGDDGRQQPQN